MGKKKSVFRLVSFLFFFAGYIKTIIIKKVINISYNDEYLQHYG